ncbi:MULTISPECIES: hypothetical protein [Pandoraea]|uniref:hypothetical protein n=1 Tax=Pandoraea TaxID=93217 RepID=UPI001F5E0491|nr:MULTISPECIES: hypothetical protein [Pandoraea]MCI3208285.1 hypothetical protein [Pandoraea sp. LA3]MDN4586314.1 hypothetical protein [Pandoraea capi]
MAASLRAWSTVVRVKTRHCERAQTAVAEASAVLTNAQQTAADAEAQRDAVQARLDNTQAVWAQSIHDNPVFSPEDWLRHDLRLKDQVAMLGQAEQQCAHAQDRVAAAQAGVTEAQQGLRRAEASRDACIEARDALVREAALAAEMAMDDESGEVAAARIYRARQRARTSRT